jgi:predicted membrane metal-binding protein
MKRFIDWKVFAATVSAAALLAWALHAWFDLSFWASLGIVLAAVLINGIVALVEDQTPGGFNNPKRSSRPNGSE